MAMAPPIVVTEDTPPDMLAGSMDLSVVLPGGRSLKMSVDRSTPMMDLLVQVTTGNKMSPAGHTLQPLNDQGPLPYKPSTPIGALDAWTIHVVPKHNVQGSGNKNSCKSLNQPFEQTFRLQVHLPRNQLFVARVSPRTKLSEILRQVCVEKNLDPLKYSLRHPNNLDLVLRPSCSLADYKLQEVTLVCNQSHPGEVSVSTVDIMSLQRETANPAYRNTLCEGSVSSGSLEGRSLSPAPSDESSASPPPLPPSRPTRKRRPAPKPPILKQKQTVVIEEKQENGVQSSTVINHSRNSSDSSGYHEASVLSDSPQNNNVPESLARHKMTRASETVSKSMTDVTVIEPTLKQAISSNSISSLSSNPTRKKKAAPPPPPNANVRASVTLGDRQKKSSISSTASSTTTLDGNETNTGVKSATLPPSSRLNSVTKEMSPPPSPSPSLSTKVDIAPPLSRQDPPAPRPRSRLMEQDDKANYNLRSKPSSPKKAPAPQPRPRKLISSPSLSTEDHLIKPDDAGQIDSSVQNHPGLISQTLPSMLMKTHKACIDELAIKLVQRQDSIDSMSGQVDNKSQDEELSLKNDTDWENSSKSLIPEHVTTNECGKPAIESRAALSAEATAWVVASKPGADSSSSDLRIVDEEIDRIFTNTTRNHIDSPDLVVEEDKLMSLSTLPSPPTSLPHCESKVSSQVVEETLDWEYKLPAPPTFRDDARSPSVTEFGTVTIANLSEVAGVKTLELVKSINKTDLEKIIESEIRTKESNVEDLLKLMSAESDENITNTESKVSGIPMRISVNKNIQLPKMTKHTPSIKLKNEESKCLSEEPNVKLVTNRVINNNHRWSIADLTSLENKQYNNIINSSSTLQNFTISTYKDTKPFEVFEDDSIKSSVGEKRDRSKDDAVFRAPKARVKEPNLSRTNSFSVESKASGPMIKRSVSYVSLLAANMPRNSQPYLAHLRQQEPPWPRLRKTTSEFNIDNQDGKTNEKSFWDDDSTQFESVKILRNILSQSQVNLTSSQDKVIEDFHKQHRDLPTSVEKLEDTFDVNSSDSKWSRAQSEEAKSNQQNICGKIQHSVSLDEEGTKASVNIQRGGGPAVNFSTWSERPKRQVSIKNDNDYISGFGKKTIITQDEDSPESLRRDSLSTTNVEKLNSARCIGIISKHSGLKLDERSKSTSDLSRIPIVRAVEFKKPFAVNSYDRSSLKPVHILEDIDKVVVTNHEKTNLDDFNNNDDENFVGVDSLARRFGVPQKRPTSLYVNSQVKDNSKTDIKDSVKLLRSLSSINTVYSKTDLTTSHVKALAKTKSGGFVVDSLPVEKDSLLTNKIHTSVESFPDGEERISAINFSVIQNTEVNKSSAASGIKSSQGPSLGALTSSVYVKHTPSQARPVSLQPVVKGFRVDSQAQPSTTSSTKTKDFRSASVVNNSYLSHKGTFQRTMSVPVDPTPPIIIKETVKASSGGITKVSSVPLFVAPNVRDNPAIVPPPPPMMPVLRPVSERRNIKLLPPPEAKPRDQLMLSIRSFSVDNLKKVTK